MWRGRSDVLNRLIPEEKTRSYKFIHLLQLAVETESSESFQREKQLEDCSG